MKNSIYTLLCFLLPLTVFAQQRAINYQSNEVMIQLISEVNIADFQKSFTVENPDLPALKLKRVTVERLNMFLFQFDDKKADAFTILKFANVHPMVAAAQLNYRLEMRDSIPDDPLFAEQWGLERIQAPDVWAFSTGGTSVDDKEIVVAIIDSGFDLEHEDLQENVWQNPAEIVGNNIDDDGNGLVDDIMGWNYFNGLPEHPISSHGTSVTGIIGAKGNNNTGVSGVNWNVKLMLFTAKFSEEIAAAYGYIIEQRLKYNQSNGAEGAFVVATNASLGINNTFCFEQPLWGGMYDPLGEVGIINVAATTNASGTNVDVDGDMPTTCESDFLISVTNSDIEEQRKGGYGPESIDLSAPGSGSVTVTSGSNYDTNFGGTSASCPHVAGSAALLFSLPCEDFATLVEEDPAASALLIKQFILDGVDKFVNFEGEMVSNGRLNLYQSAELLHSYCVANDAERTDNTFAEKYLNEAGFISIFNSGSSQISVDFSTMNFEPVDIAIYDAIGRLVLEDAMTPSAFSNQTYTVDTFSWATGIYFINVRGIDAKVTAKFLKN